MEHPNDAWQPTTLTRSRQAKSAFGFCLMLGGIVVMIVGFYTADIVVDMGP